MIHLLDGVNHARPQTQYLDSSFPSDALARETPHEDSLTEQGIEYGRALNQFGFRTVGDATAFKLRWC